MDKTLLLTRRERRRALRKFNREVATTPRVTKKIPLPAGLSTYVGSVKSDWQTVVALLIVALAATSLLWAKFRRRKVRLPSGLRTAGCAPPDQSATHQSIIFHARKGERPQVIVKNK